MPSSLKIAGVIIAGSLTDEDSKKAARLGPISASCHSRKPEAGRACFCAHSYRDLIVALANKHRPAAVYPFSFFVREV